MRYYYLNGFDVKQLPHDNCFYVQILGKGRYDDCPEDATPVEVDKKCKVYHDKEGKTWLKCLDRNGNIPRS